MGMSDWAMACVTHIYIPLIRNLPNQCSLTYLRDCSRAVILLSHGSPDSDDDDGHATTVDESSPVHSCYLNISETFDEVTHKVLVQKHQNGAFLKIFLRGHVITCQSVIFK